MRTPIDEFVYRYGGTFVYHLHEPWYVRGHPERERFEDDEDIDPDNEVELEGVSGSPQQPHGSIHVPFDEIDTTMPQPGYYYIPETDSIAAIGYNPTRRYKRGFDLESARLMWGPGWTNHYQLLKNLWRFQPSPLVPSREIAIFGTSVYMYNTIVGELEGDTIKFTTRIKREMRHHLTEVLHAAGYKTVWNKPGQ